MGEEEEEGQEEHGGGHGQVGGEEEGTPGGAAFWDSGMWAAYLPTASVSSRDTRPPNNSVTWGADLY